MPTHGPFLPDTGTTEGTDPWDNPGNIVSDNAAYATQTNGIMDPLDNHLIANFTSLNIPANETLVGIEVEVEVFTSADDIGENLEVTLRLDQTLLGNPKNIDPNTNETIYSLGGSADLWSTSLTVADLNSGNFKVESDSSVSAGTVTFSVDFVRVTFYTESVVGDSVKLNPYHLWLLTGD